MKISVNRVRRLVREEISHDGGRDLGHSDNEGRMAKSQLFKIGKYAQSLEASLQDQDDLPQWILSKIAVMSSDIGKIKHYLEYKIMRLQSAENPGIEEGVHPPPPVNKPESKQPPSAVNAPTKPTSPPAIRTESEGADFYDIDRDIAILDNQTFTRGDLYDMISDFSKELSGRRNLPIEKLDNMDIEQVAKYYQDMFDSDEYRSLEAENSEMNPRGQGRREENWSPRLRMYMDSIKQQGMGRRPKGSKAQRRMESRKRIENTNVEITLDRFIDDWH